MSPAQRRRTAHRYNRHAAVFASILMSAGLLMLAAGSLGVWRGWQTLSWPTAEATILDSKLSVEEIERTIPMTDRLRGGLKETGEKVSLAIRYRYTVDGVAFEGTALEPWDFGVPGEEKLLSLAARTAPAPSQSVTLPVAYDPRDHRRSYLLPGPSRAAITMSIVGLILTLAGFVLGRIQRRA